MRKITQRIAEAYHKGKSLKIDNTETDGNAVYLFGKKIIERREGINWFTLAGWNTPTTRERLNGILFNDYSRGVYSKNFISHFQDKPIKDNEWYSVTTDKPAK